MAQTGARLLVILGDQLNLDSKALQAIDRERDVVWMCESHEESTHVWSSRIRIVQFLSAMRHFAKALIEQGFSVTYHQIDLHAPMTLQDALSADIRTLRPSEVLLVQPGDYRVREAIVTTVQSHGVVITCLPDQHFLCSDQAFEDWASSRNQLRLEHFYRFQRRRLGVLMAGDKPEGAAWNFDEKNRRSFPKKTGPMDVPTWPKFHQDQITTEVIRVVNRVFADHPGITENFSWPVSRTDAENALRSFIDERLPGFGPYQDAMWTEQPFLWHAGISASLNLKLIDPQTAINAAIQAYQENRAPLASVEGFVRQILGWREFVRGIYWQQMPGYETKNALQASQPLPKFFWTGETDMECLHHTLQQTFEFGYAHHIQRLMVTGLFTLLLGVDPLQVHRWYLAVYVDAVEWVELPNTIGMSQFADGGLLASKPYVASGRYIQKMSNYCRGCRYDPGKAVGDDACPFTTLYWDFLQRHAEKFSRHPRTALQWRNLDRIGDDQKLKIRKQAEAIRQCHD